MPSLHEFQKRMRDQALDRLDRTLLVGMLKDDHPFPPEERLEIYRNNTIIGLLDALSASYPVVRKLVGEDFFTMMARDFVRAHPPVRAPMLLYGGEFPAFVTEYAKAAPLPYLSDVARLEAAWNHAYNAADARPMAPEALRTFPEDDLGELIFVLHPSLRFVASAYPVVAIWRANQSDSDGDEIIDLGGGGDMAVVCRPDAEVFVRSVGGGAFSFLMALSAGQTLGTAWETALTTDPEFQLMAELAALLAAGVFVSAEIRP